MTDSEYTFTEEDRDELLRSLLEALDDSFFSDFVLGHHEIEYVAKMMKTIPLMEDALKKAAYAFDQITDESINLRVGGPDIMDLNGLSNGLSTAVDIAADAKELCRKALSQEG